MLLPFSYTKQFDGRSTMTGNTGGGLPSREGRESGVDLYVLMDRELSILSRGLKTHILVGGVAGLCIQHDTVGRALNLRFEVRVRWIRMSATFGKEIKRGPRNGPMDGTRRRACPSARVHPCLHPCPGINTTSRVDKISLGFSLGRVGDGAHVVV